MGKLVLSFSPVSTRGALQTSGMMTTPLPAAPATGVHAEAMKGHRTQDHQPSDGPNHNGLGPPPSTQPYYWVVWGHFVS